MFGKNKKTTASDILKMIAELPEDEQDAVKAMLNGAEAPEEPSEDPAEEQAEEAAKETEDSETATEQEAEEMPKEEPESLEASENGEEPAEEPAPEADAEAASEEAEESQDRDFGAEIAALSEAIAALSNRMDALDAKKAEAESEEDAVGQAFGPEITDPKKTEDDELEKARIEAFGF